tara:strand:- start:502 stop:879 length:378 start_codon:yes stop_codon:yes gene_type:complete
MRQSFLALSVGAVLATSITPAMADPVDMSEFIETIGNDLNRTYTLYDLKTIPAENCLMIGTRGNQSFSVNLPVDTVGGCYMAMDIINDDKQGQIIDDVYAFDSDGGRVAHFENKSGTLKLRKLSR